MKKLSKEQQFLSVYYELMKQKETNDAVSQCYHVYAFLAPMETPAAARKFYSRERRVGNRPHKIATRAAFSIRLPLITISVGKRM